MYLIYSLPYISIPAVQQLSLCTDISHFLGCPMSFSRGAFLSAVQLYSQSLNFPFFFTPHVTVCILLSLMTVFSSRGFGFSSAAIFFLSSFHYMHCHLVTVFMSCLLFSLTVNNLFFISGLYCHVFIGFLSTNFSCHLC